MVAAVIGVGSCFRSKMVIIELARTNLLEEKIKIGNILTMKDLTAAFLFWFFCIFFRRDHSSTQIILGVLQIRISPCIYFKVGFHHHDRLQH